jgi:hypothetical protein
MGILNSNWMNVGGQGVNTSRSLECHPEHQCYFAYAHTNALYTQTPSTLLEKGVGKQTSKHTCKAHNACTLTRDQRPH